MGKYLPNIKIYSADNKTNIIGNFYFITPPYLKRMLSDRNTIKYQANLKLELSYLDIYLEPRTCHPIIQGQILPCNTHKY